MSASACTRCMAGCVFVADLLYTFPSVVDLLWILLYSLLYNNSTTNRTSGVRSLYASLRRKQRSSGSARKVISGDVTAADLNANARGKLPKCFAAGRVSATSVFRQSQTGARRSSKPAVKGRRLCVARRRDAPGGQIDDDTKCTTITRCPVRKKL